MHWIINIYIYIYIYMCGCTYIYKCMYIHPPTHTNTHTQTGRDRHSTTRMHVTSHEQNACIRVYAKIYTCMCLQAPARPGLLPLSAWRQVTTMRIAIATATARSLPTHTHRHEMTTNVCVNEDAAWHHTIDDTTRCFLFLLVVPWSVWTRIRRWLHTNTHVLTRSLKLSAICLQYNSNQGLSERECGGDEVGGMTRIGVP